MVQWRGQKWQQQGNSPHHCCRRHTLTSGQDGTKNAQQAQQTKGRREDQWWCGERGLHTQLTHNAYRRCPEVNSAWVVHLLCWCEVALPWMAHSFKALDLFVFPIGSIMRPSRAWHFPTCMHPRLLCCTVSAFFTAAFSGLRPWSILNFSSSRIFWRSLNCVSQP